MSKLPITAFEIKGIGEYLHLTIIEAWDSPPKKSGTGGYDCKGNIIISTGNYYIESACYFSTEELQNFNTALQKCYRDLAGTAKLKNIENSLDLVCKFDELGHAVLEGRFQEHSYVNNILYFEIATDQTYIKNTILQLEQTSRFFNNMY